jgi:flavin reductase (DIM6/NTAB) family NADH-FMN oxidoreductase RutF
MNHMNQFQEIAPGEIRGNPFQMIGSDWMLITASKGDDVNTMTASWGGLGIMWGRPAAYIVIRPQRYTREFVEAAATFSLSFLDSRYKPQLDYLGSVSGRDEPKIARSGLTLAEVDGTPYFAESSLVLICRKLYHQRYDPACFIDPSLEENYPKQDYHTLYIGEIITVLQSHEGD